MSCRCEIGILKLELLAEGGKQCNVSSTVSRKGNRSGEEVMDILSRVNFFPGNDKVDGFHTHTHTVLPRIASSALD